MTEEEHLSEIRTLRDTPRQLPTAVFARIDTALAEHPRSTRLWCIRGDCIQLGSEDCPLSLRDALASYEHALKIDPACAIAHESIGYYFDVMEEDLPRSETAFRAAVAYGQRDWSYAGLARVLAERGNNREEVLALLAQCPDQRSPVIQEAREETERGEWEPKSMQKKPNKAPEPTRAIGSHPQGSEVTNTIAGVAHL